MASPPVVSCPAITQVDPAVFRLRYFAECMACTFCHDSCCQYGCDVTLPERDKILSLAPQLEPRIGVPASEWFDPEVEAYQESPDALYVRSQTRGGACVFLDREGRGCKLHAFCIDEKRDYHQLKPSVCWLFPVTVDMGLLHPSQDVTTDLVCAGQGQTLYRACREELKAAYGASLVEELDALEAQLAPF